MPESIAGRRLPTTRTERAKTMSKEKDRLEIIYCVE